MTTRIGMLLLVMVVAHGAALLAPSTNHDQHQLQRRIRQDCEQVLQANADIDLVRFCQLLINNPMLKRGGYDFIRFGRSTKNPDKKASDSYDFIRFGKKK